MLYELGQARWLAVRAANTPLGGDNACVQSRTRAELCCRLRARLRSCLCDIGLAALNRTEPPARFT